MAMPTTVAAAPAAAAAPRSGSRAALLLAIAIDAATLGLALFAGAAIGAAWLLLRSEAGSIDAPFRDAALALALCAAAVPAWTAWQWRALVEHGTTFGGRIARLDGVPAAPSRRLLRLLLHPISVPAWCWLAATVAVAAAPGDRAIEWATAGVALVALLLALLGLASLVQLLRRPHARSLHERLASIGARHPGES